jgi:subtilisin-like proprotein convertase family protein
VISVAIPDSSATGATHSIVVNADIKIEATQIKIWATHPNISDLGIEVTSPSGTKSIVINMNNAVRGVADYVGDVFLTNAFYGESTQGVWTIKVIDGKTSNTGTLTRWSLNFLGAN